MHSPESSNAGLPHILVVDDDTEIGALLSRYLSSQGLRVTGNSIR